MAKSWFALILGTLLCVSCVELTEGGKRVTYVTKQEAPKKCQMIGDVNVGQGFSRKMVDVQSVKNALRNQAAQKKANFLVIDTIEGYSSQHGTSYSGTGRAYWCPP